MLVKKVKALERTKKFLGEFEKRRLVENESGKILRKRKSFVENLKKYRCKHEKLEKRSKFLEKQRKILDKQKKNLK